MYVLLAHRPRGLPAGGPTPVENHLRLEDVRRAWEAQDPELPRLVVALASQPDAPPRTPVRDGAPTVGRLLRELRSPAFRKKSRPEQKRWRVEQLQSLESPQAEVPLPDRFRLDGLLMELWR